jgi:hypothetical protein
VLGVQARYFPQVASRFPQAPTALNDHQPFVQFAISGIARRTSPAGITCRPGDTAPARSSLGQAPSVRDMCPYRRKIKMQLSHSDFAILRWSNSLFFEINSLI